MKYFTFLLMFTGLYVMLNAQSSGFNYENAWKNIEKLSQEQKLPESAAAI